jgi:hypothetical protein
MKTDLPLEWACSLLGDKNYKSLQAHFQNNSLFRILFISVALVTQVVGLVLFCAIGLVIGSFVINLLR